MMQTQTVKKREVTIVKANPAAFIVSVIGLAVQGLSGLIIWGAVSLATAFYNLLPASVIGEWSINGGPFIPGAAWPIVGALTAYTVGVFALGLLGVVLLRRGYANDIRLGAAFVLASAILAATTGWGLLLGSALMITGAVVGFFTIRRVNAGIPKVGK